jgi:hypothetical protein
MAGSAGLHVEKLFYAAAMLDGADRIARSEKEPSLDRIGVAFYLLVCFGIESALKAFLDFQSAPGDWKKSHNLADLLTRSSLEPELWPGAGDDIRQLSRYHQEHWFRYPEKAAVADVFKPSTALILLDHLIGTVSRMTGTTKLP